MRYGYHPQHPHESGDLHCPGSDRAFIGSRKGVRSRPLVWVGKLQFVALMILIVTLGVNLGANDEVIASLGQIGLAALLITVLAMFGSLLFLTLLRRFVLRLDHVGLPGDRPRPRTRGAYRRQADTP